MSEFEHDEAEEVEIFTDEEGNEYYVHRYVDVGDKKYAILVYIDDEEESDEESEGCGCGCEGKTEGCGDSCGCDDECEVEIARVEVADGEQSFVFIDPEDPEYDKVCEAYEKLMESEPYEA
jgi:uncharacterized protein YrzB (UPF0473 family)